MSDNVIERLIMQKQQAYWWQKAGISLAIWLSLVLVMIRLASVGPNILGIFGFYILAWLIIVPLSIAAIILRILKRLRTDSFLYIFFGVADAGLSTAGIYFGIGNSKSNWIWLAAYLICALLALIILAEPIYGTVNNDKQKIG
jgi:hypothetical protein